MGGWENVVANAKGVFSCVFLPFPLSNIRETESHPFPRLFILVLPSFQGLTVILPGAAAEATIKAARLLPSDAPYKKVKRCYLRALRGLHPDKNQDLSLEGRVTAQSVFTTLTEAAAREKEAQ